MKRSFLPTLLLILTLCTCGRAQNLIGDLITFEGTAFADWNDDEGRFDFTVDGSASATPFWGNRGPIRSTSGQNALILLGAEGEEVTRFKSPFLEFPAGQDVWLGFHQYYRQNDGGSATIEVREDGQLRRTIDLSANLKPGVETGPYDTVMVNLTNELAGRNNMTVEFVFSGRSYFWLLDDIGFYDGPPQTKPDVFGNYLREEGYDFAVDSANWAYVPNQLVIQFEGGTRESYIDSLRDEFGARLIDSCACDFVELWEIDGALFQAQGGEQEEATGTTGILSNIIKAKSKTMVDGVDLNYLTNTEPVPAQPITNAPLAASDLSGIGNSAANPLRIAIMDTGIDYQYDGIKPYVKIREENQTGMEDDLLNCLPNDPIGWNYVDNNNNPFDDNGHGTHVAGIIADSLNKYGFNRTYEFVAYKTHDNNGVSSLFDVICATFQSSLDDIDIINDSWGFFGDSSKILGNAIDTARMRDILIISAAGNDGIDLDTLVQYPACYPDSNIITVGATVVDPNAELGVARANFSNFSPGFVDILAPGVDIFSAAPSWTGVLRVLKSGTSMSTPMVTAGVAKIMKYYEDERGPDAYDYYTVKDCLLNSAPNSDLTDAAQNGWLLTYDYVCIVGTSSGTLPADEGFQVFPNPFRQGLTITSLAPREAATIRLLGADGRELSRFSSRSWSPNEQQSITLPDLPAGLYLLQIGGQNYVWTQKLIRY
ncbi:MAG: S8 family peptidase [Lewinella sp.]